MDRIQGKSLIMRYAQNLAGFVKMLQKLVESPKIMTAEKTGEVGSFFCYEFEYNNERERESERERGKERLREISMHSYACIYIFYT